MPPAQYAAQKTTLSPYNYHDPLDALAMAHDINARGGVAWEIVAPDGSSIGREEIAAQVRVRAAVPAA